MARRPRLPACTRRRAGHGAIKVCGCKRCAILRYRAVRFFGTESDYPSAAITRAVAENA